MDKRYFSEQEAADLVVKAAKLQEKAGGDKYTPGISYSELEKMAAEAGIDPAYLEQAFKGEPTGEEEAKSFLGIPLWTEFERVVEVELPPENFDVVSELLPPRMGGHGPRGTRMLNVGQQVGRSLQMPIMKGPAYGTMRMTSRNGRTRITTRQTMFFPFMAGLYPGLIGAFISTMMMLPGETRGPGNPLVNIPIAIALLVAGLIAYFALAKSGQRKMRELTDEIAHRVQEEGELLRANLERPMATKAESSEQSVEGHQGL